MIFQAFFAVLAVFFLVACPKPSQAQSRVLFVSSHGTDAFNCAAPVNDAHGNLPCQTFEQAVSVATDNSTISCVNPNDYSGADNIHVSLTIDCTASGGLDALRFIINAPGKNVRLRGVSVDGLGPGFSLIEVVAAASVELENMTLTGGDHAIYDHRTGPGRLFVRNSIIVGSSGAGVLVVPQSGSSINVVLDNVTARDNDYGLAVGTGGRVMINHSVFSQNTTAGVEADSGAIIELNDTLVSNNATGIISSSNSISLSNSGIQSNNVGISGPTQSFGNNRFIRNAVSDGTAPTPFGGTSTEAGLR